MSFGRPTGDVLTAGWTNRNGSIVGLFQSVDESVESAADFVLGRLPSLAFNPSGTISGEVSRAAYTTPGGTVCTNIVAHALGVNDDYHKFRLIVPNATDLHQLQPVVKVLHGVGVAGEDIITTGGVGTNGMTDAWLDLGWPVLSAQEGGDTWGNEAARLGFLDIWSAISALFNCPGYLMYCVSMGVAAGLNYLVDAKANGLPVLAFAGNSGASNVQFTYDHNSSLRTSIRAAYGLGAVTSSDPTYVAAVDTADGGHDPQKRAASDFPAMPMRYYVGNSDGTISKSNNTDLMVAKMTGYATELAEIVYSGDHVDPASYQPADCCAFFQRALA